MDVRLRVGNLTLHSALPGFLGTRWQSSQPSTGGKEEFRVTTVMRADGWMTKAQLWGLLVVASYDPDFGPEERANEGKLVDVEARQLGGFEG